MSNRSTAAAPATLPIRLNTRYTDHCDGLCRVGTLQGAQSMWTQQGIGSRPSAPGVLRRALAREPIEPAWPFLPALLALVAGWVIMTWPWLLGRVTIPWDAKAHFQPQIQFLAQSIARGEWPWWTPHVFSGHPQIADPQSMMFSPPFLLLAMVNGNPSLWAVDMTVLLSALVGAVALMAWMRDQEWHWAGAILAGLVFAFGASMAWRLQHMGQVLSLAYWPLAMLSIDRAIRLGSYRWGLLAGLIGAFIILGRDQVALLVTYLLVAYVFWRWWSADDRGAVFRSAGGPLVSGAVLALAVIAVPVVLTSLLAAESNRPSIDFEGAGRGSMHPALFLTLLLPQVFGAAFRMEDYWGPPSFAWPDTGLFIAQNMGQVYLGAAPILLLLLALWQGQLFNREIRFFTAAFGLAILYALGWYTPVFRLLYEVLPGVKYFRRPADATFLIGGLGAVLVGYVTHLVFTKPWQRVSENAIAATAGVVVIAFVVALSLALWLDKIGPLVTPALIGFGCIVAGAAALAFVKPRIALETWPMAIVLAGVTALDLGYNNGPSSSSALPPQTYEAMQPSTRNATVLALKSRLAESKAADTSGARRDRIELMGLGFHWPNVSLSHGLENTLGYNPVRLRDYSLATGAEDTVGLPDQRKFSALFPSYKSMLADLLGLRYVAAGQPLEWHDKALKTGDLKLLAKTEDGWLYENPRALPRVIMAGQAWGGGSFAEMMKTGRWPDGFDPTRAVLLEGSSRVVFTALGATTTTEPVARIASYRNTEVVVEATSPRGGWLVLNDPWHPWWFAEVDGKPAPILKANVIMRAVELPAGAHRVSFQFRPLAGALKQLRER